MGIGYNRIINSSTEESCQHQSAAFACISVITTEIWVRRHTQPATQTHHYYFTCVEERGPGSPLSGLLQSHHSQKTSRSLFWFFYKIPAALEYVTVWLKEKVLSIFITLTLKPNTSTQLVHLDSGVPPPTRVFAVPLGEPGCGLAELSEARQKAWSVLSCMKDEWVSIDFWSDSTLMDMVMSSTSAAVHEKLYLTAEDRPSSKSSFYCEKPPAALFAFTYLWWNHLNFLSNGLNYGFSF